MIPRTVATVSAEWAGLKARDITDLFFTPFNGTTVELPTTATVNLALRGRETSQQTGEVVYSLASDEQLLQDYALVAEQPTAPGGARVSDAVRFVLKKIGAYLGTPTGDGDVELDLIVWFPGVSGWDYLTPILQKASLRLFCDEWRRWQLVPATFDTPGMVVIDSGVNATGAVDSISRDRAAEWFDSAVLTYQWEDSAGNQHTRYDTFAPFNHTKTFTQTFDAVYPGPGAAQALVERAQGRGRVLDLAAVSDYHTRPGQTITSTLPDMSPVVGRVSSVRWAFPDDEMRVGTRNVTES